MCRKLFTLIILIGLCCLPALAQEQEKKMGPSISEWLKDLQQKIALIAPKKAMPQSTMVAGVRGAKEDASTKLYWKGKKGEEPVTEEELAEFKEAIEFASKGDHAKAVHELDEFMKLYPDSVLIPDVKKTMDMVSAEMKSEKKEEKR